MKKTKLRLLDKDEPSIDLSKAKYDDEDDGEHAHDEYDDEYDDDECNDDEYEDDDDEPNDDAPDDGEPLFEEEIENPEAVLEREHRRKKLAMLLSVVISAVCVGVGLFLTWYLLIVDTISVKGNKDITSEEIISASGLETGKHIWLENTSAAKKALEDMPYIGSAQIERIYPDKLVITVAERVEAAVVMGLSTNAVIDKDGNVLFMGERASYDGLMKIYGLSGSGFKLNTPLGDASTFQIRTTLELLNAIVDAGLVEAMDYLDVSNSLSVYFITTTGLRVQFGQPDKAAEKLHKLKLVLPKLKQLGLDAKGTVDVSTVGDPVYSPPTNTLVGDQPVTLMGSATGTNAPSPANASSTNASPTDATHTDAAPFTQPGTTQPDATPTPPPSTPTPTLNYDGFSG